MEGTEEEQGQEGSFSRRRRRSAGPAAGENSRKIRTERDPGHLAIRQTLAAQGSECQTERGDRGPASSNQGGAGQEGVARAPCRSSAAAWEEEGPEGTERGGRAVFVSQSRDSEAIDVALVQIAQGRPRAATLGMRDRTREAGFLSFPGEGRGAPLDRLHLTSVTRMAAGRRGKGCHLTGTRALAGESLPCPVTAPDCPVPDMPRPQEGC